MTVIGPKKCFAVILINDNISEPVETFQVYLEASSPEDEVTLIQQSLTIVIIDDGKLLHAYDRYTCALLILFQQYFMLVTDHIGSSDPVCTLNEYLLVDQIKEEKEKVVEAIVNLLPFDLPTPTSNNSDSLDQVYEQLAVYFKQTPSTEGQNEFLTAIEEIYTSYASECVEDSGDVPGTGDIAVLAATFRKLTLGLNSIRRKDLAQARDIYGKFLCYEGKKGGTRQKRQSDIFIPSECECPNSGVTEPCHFFVCLDSSVTKFIMGFGNSIDNTPCIGFIVDTTGSMWNEIEAVKRVILQFIKSQADSTHCYLLVPFNDYSYYDITDYPNSKLVIQ